MQRRASSLVTLRARILERSSLVVAVAVLGGVLVNGFLNLANTALSLPLFLDAIGTAVVAVLFGPVAGAVTGIGSNLFQEVLYGFPGAHWQFGIVNAATGIIMGLLARHGLFRTGAHVVVAVLLVTVASAILGAAVALAVFGGASGIEVDYISMGLLLTGKPMFWAAFLARIPANLVDKALAVLAAFFAYRAAFLQPDD
jgi:energy-coupling factor transport system substrate-specific component